MPLVKANNVDIEVETHGRKGDPAVLLIMGLAAQLTYWPKDYIDALVEEGYYVIAFDNRDIGLSQKLRSKRAPNPVHMTIAGMVGLKGIAPYTLRDMAKDAVGVLDALSVDSAHVVGVSMGGMIGQVMSALFPDRVSSFTAVMTSTNNPKLPRADASITREIFAVRTRAKTREELVDRTVALWKVIGTPESGHDPIEFRERMARAVDRCNYPAGVRRQIAAVIASGDLRKWSKKVSAPTLVIHGSIDPLVPFQGGLDVAANIRDARVEIIDGMAHDLPPKFLPVITDLTLEHLQSAQENAEKAQAA